MTKRKHLYGDTPRVGRDRSGPAPASRAPVLTPKPKTSSLLEQAAGESAITHAEGLARAYAQGDAHTHGTTTEIAGSHTARDCWDDVTKIPFWGDSHKIYHMQMAQQALAANPQATRVVGHSLGGAVPLQAQKDNPKLASRTYGAPVWDVFGTDNTERGNGIFDKPQGKPGGVERYRSFGDPVSFFDGSAHSALPGKEALSFSGPHAYQSLAAQHMSEGLAAQANPDGSQSKESTDRYPVRFGNLAPHAAIPPRRPRAPSSRPRTSGPRRGRGRWTRPWGPERPTSSKRTLVAWALRCPLCSRKIPQR
jgi:hypothetical protein